MQLKTAILKNDSTASLVILAIVFGLFAIGMETVFNMPVKFPGHRAFPGALALLVFAEAFAPLALLLFAGVISAFLVAAGGAPMVIVAVWLVAAFLIYAISNTRLAKTIFFFVIGGLIFGGLRYLAFFKGFHHTPELIRLAGHLSFGGLAGLISFGACRGFSSRE
jgi:hypothetical protein